MTKSLPTSSFIRASLLELDEAKTNWGWEEDHLEKAFEEIKTFVKETGRLPSRVAKDPYEVSLHKKLMKWSLKDPVVRAWRELIKPIQQRGKEGHKATIEEMQKYYAEHGKLPPTYGPEATTYTKSLCKRFGALVHPKSPYLDEEAVAWITKIREEIKAEKLAKKVPKREPEPLFVPKIEYKREWAT